MSEYSKEFIDGATAAVQERFNKLALSREQADWLIDFADKYFVNTHHAQINFNQIKEIINQCVKDA